jgi:chromate transporter
MIYLELFLTFFMIGAFTFGGGYAMLPMMQEQVALRWGDIIPEKVIADFVAVSESTPGPFAVNMSTYVGSEVGGVFGSFCATLGVVLPSFLIILIVAKCYEKFKKSKVIAGCMTGLKPAVVGLIANAVVTIARTVFFAPGVIWWTIFTQPITYVYLGLFGAMLVLALKKVHPILIICISAVVGIAVGYLGL